jgi:ribA/ribD-fused uncharacterized protein
MIFHGEYAFLSNFYPVRIEFEGEVYQSVEHAYQAAKTTDQGLRLAARSLTASQARRWGQKLRLRPDWEEVKLQVMRDLLKAKFSLPHLRAKLLATGEMELIEGNYWHDTYWGVCQCEQCGGGANHLGKLLMELRQELR